MIEKLIQHINNLRLVRAFKLSTTPRWFILLIDMLIVSASYALVVTSDMYISQALPDGLTTIGRWLLIVGVYFVMSLITKSYACIIRLSVIEDLYRVFQVVVLSTIILLAISMGTQLIADVMPLRYWNIILVGALSFSLMMIERLITKYFYMMLTHGRSGRRRVLVLGTSLHSLILANALNSEIGGRYEPVGLLSLKHGKHENSSINGFKVFDYDSKMLREMCDEHDIDALIFNDSDSAQLRDGIADAFIRNSIALLSINKVEEFDLDSEKRMSEAAISTHVREVQIEDLLGRDPIVLDNTLVRNHIEGACVMVTGACGSIGSEIVRQAAAYHAGCIVLVDQAETPMHDMHLEMQRKYPQAHIELFMGDVQNSVRMEEAFKRFKPQYVFHAAAYKHVPMMEINPTEAVMTNVMGTMNMADLALKYNVYKFVMISTDKAVNPTNVMGCTKRLAEIYCQSLFFDAQKRGLKTQFITTRFGNVLGSNGSVIPLFRKQIAEGGPVTVTHHDIIRYFMTIPEACSLVLEAGCMGNGGEIYIFDMGEPVKIYDLAERMISLAGLRPGIDIQIKEVGLRPGEKLYEELLNDKELTTATLNKKIMIARVRSYEYREVRDNIAHIIELAAEGNVHSMIFAMKEFVPEYKSQHSEFESIDREIERLHPAQSSDPVPETEKYY